MPAQVALGLLLITFETAGLSKSVLISSGTVTAIKKKNHTLSDDVSRRKTEQEKLSSAARDMNVSSLNPLSVIYNAPSVFVCAVCTHKVGTKRLFTAEPNFRGNHFDRREKEFFALGAG